VAGTKSKTKICRTSRTFYTGRNELVAFYNSTYYTYYQHHTLEHWGACVCRRGLPFERMFCDCSPFRNRFNVAPLGPVPDRKSIVTWVTTFRQTGNVTRRRTSAHQIWSLAILLWVFLKSCVNINRQRTLQDLKAEIANIPATMLAKVMVNANTIFKTV
jgi:hypothetical protein